MNTNANANQDQNYNEYKSTIVDSPVMKGENDLLNLNDYRNALIDFLKHAQTPITISLQGEWGSGKTSLMRSLEDALCVKENSPFFNAWINTWQFSLLSDSSDASQVVINILQSIVKQIAEKDPEDKFRAQADNTVSLIMKGARFAYDIAGAALLKKMELEKEDIDNAIANFKSNDIEKLQSKPEVKIDGRVSLVEQLKNQIDSLVNEVLNCAQNKGIKQGFIFFIDDLDRIKPTLAVEVLEVLKNILDFTHCISIIAIDYSVVVDGLKPKLIGKSDKEYRVYFDKLVQIQIAMPVFYYNTVLFLRKLLDKISFFESINECDGREYIVEGYVSILGEIVERSVGRNPRGLKRVINNYSLAESFIRTRMSAVEKDNNSVAAGDDFVTKPSQVDLSVKMAVFILVCIQIAYPQIYKFISSDYALFFVDSYVLKEQQADHKGINQIKIIKSSAGLDAENIFVWEKSLLDLCEADDSGSIKDRFDDILIILNRLYSIFTQNGFPITSVMLPDYVQWICVTDV